MVFDKALHRRSEDAGDADAEALRDGAELRRASHREPADEAGGKPGAAVPQQRALEEISEVAVDQGVDIRVAAALQDPGRETAQIG